MPSLDLSALWQAQHNHQPQQYLMAFSGGRDSVALLHLMHHAPQRTADLSAVYVHHGWHQEADAWADFCAAFCQRYGMPFQVLRVQCAHHEAAARQARYAALEALITPQTVLLTAHHADDQLETFFMNLLRGSGLDGLCGMPFTKRFGQGQHWRPLLQHRRAQIEAYLAAHQLDYVDDPSNQETRFLRTRLRPLLQQWEALQHQAGESLLRSMRHLNQARQLQEALLAGQHQGDYPWAQQVQTHGALFAQHQLRYWLKDKTGQMPPEKRLLNFIQSIKDEDNHALMSYAGQQFRHYSGWIFVEPQEALAPPPAVTCDVSYWQGVGYVQIKRLPLDLSACYWALYPQALYFRPQGKRYPLKLKQYFQDAGVAPSRRRRIPLLCHGRDVIWLGGSASADYPEVEIDFRSK